MQVVAFLAMAYLLIANKPMVLEIRKDIWLTEHTYRSAADALLCCI